MIKRTDDPIKKAVYLSKIPKDETDLKDFDKKLNKFPNIFLKDEDQRKYDIISTISFKLPHNILFAVNSAFCLSYDFKGKIIYDPYDYTIELSTLFLNIFPQNDSSYVNLSCFKDQLEYY